MTRIRPHRRRSALIGALLAVSFVAACGSSDDGVSSEEAFCNAGDDLRADITALVNLDLIGGGTDALQENIDAIGEDLTALKDSGSDVAGPELEALDSSLSELTDAAGALGDEISVSNATAAVTAIAKLGTAATAAYETFSTTCS